MLCRFCNICHGTIWDPPGWSKVTSICHIFTLSAFLHWVWEGEGWLPVLFFFLVRLGKEVNMVCEGPYSCKSHWNVWACPRQIPSPTQVKITLCIKSSCARKTKLLAAILITKLCPVSKILWTWKHICSLAEHHYPFMEKYHLLGQPRMFLACYLYPLQKIKCLSVWILHLVLSLRGQARPQSVLTLMYSLEMPVS